jgi:DNA-binding winged helix-turn-helix (wHTH) protein
MMRRAARGGASATCTFHDWAKPPGMSVYAFGPFILDTAGRRLTRDGQRMAVPGKAWQILRMLAEAGGRLVSHETFRARLWPNVVVEDRTLTVHMSTLRKALGDGSASLIETVSREGYRLAAPVRVLPQAGPQAEGAPPIATAKSWPCGPSRRPNWPRPTAISGSASPTP